MTSLAHSRRWEVVPFDEAAATSIATACGVAPLVARIMAGRGITTPEEAKRFLEPSLSRDWEDPSCIPGLSDVVQRIERALDEKECIAVFGDFDVDGISATCLMTSVLRELGGNVMPFIPRRFDEGYGLSDAAMDRLLEIVHPDLIVTVDTGIASRAEVKELLDIGIDVAVTDHHEPGDLVPCGIAVCDPKIDPDCPSRELAGVGVALKVAYVLGEHYGQPDLWRSFIDIATLGTLSDMMLLTGENRSLVYEGMKQISTVKRVGLAALAEQAHRSLDALTSDDLAFSLIPRLNAAGRMDDPSLALDLLMANDEAEAQELAEHLEAINQERRSIESQLAEDAMAMAEATYDGGRVVVVGSEGWHEGVKGIVASRLVSHYHVPVLLFTISDGIARGSGRSVGSVNLFQAVEQCSDLLVRFGGHAGAVGVTLEAGNLDAFRDRMQDILAALPSEDFEDRSPVAAQVTLSEMTVDTINSLSVMQPFGQGNEAPVLAACGITMGDRHRRGNEGKHFSFNACDAWGRASCIMFNAQDVESLTDCDEAVDLIFEPKVEAWQNRVSVKLHVRDVLRRDRGDLEDIDDATVRLVDGLFDRADEFLNESEMAGLARARQFHTKVVGVTFEGRQEALNMLEEGQELALVREPSNPYDPNAISVVAQDGTCIGYLKRLVAAAIAPLMDRGADYIAQVLDITGGADGQSLGVNVVVSIRSDPASVDELTLVNERSAERARLSALTTAQLTEELRALLIGDNELLPAQSQALENLDAGINTLCIMATGRGKSLIFHVHAARCALMQKRVSLFVYPLRALVSDQAYHLAQVFDRLGMVTRVLTGETPLETREAIFSDLDSGSVDILLTTPEFLSIHSASFARTGRIGFVVIDEAHHAGQASGGSRPAYLDMPRILEELGHPCVLAVTATASDPVAAEIRRLLSIPSEGVVIDTSCRENLHVLDERGGSARDDRLVSLLAAGEKTLVYVNSREQTLALARTLRRRVWDAAHRIAFYNGGLSRSDRAAVEEAFRNGALTMVVTTSAFGEGVNLPDVRHIVLYHLPFDEVSFNQMSGRAGRDGSDAWIHLAYSGTDARINERLLASDAPTRDDLVTLYRVLTQRDRMARKAGLDSFSATNTELAEDCLAISSGCALNDKGVSCGVAIFRELGFITISGYGLGRHISMIPTPERMDLTQSIRYLEGLRALESFAQYKDWALSSPSDVILAHINQPIVPDTAS